MRKLSLIGPILLYGIFGMVGYVVLFIFLRPIGGFSMPIPPTISILFVGIASSVLAAFYMLISEEMMDKRKRFVLREVVK